MATSNLPVWRPVAGIAVANYKQGKQPLQTWNGGCAEAILGTGPPNALPHRYTAI
jgi:hypothetical protein